jgi:hypothetical protein
MNRPDILEMILTFVLGAFLFPASVNSKTIHRGCSHAIISE